MGFMSSQADPCIWLRKNTKLNLYEYIAVYVDVLCIAEQNPKELINILNSKYHLKVKDDGPLTYDLGADYFHDPDGTMVCQPKKYIEKWKENYIRLFNTEPSKGLKIPLEKNDHPELDITDILEGQQVLELSNQIIHIYLIKILIGSIQFVVMFRESYLKTYQILWAKVSLLLTQWMQILIIA